MMSFQFPSLLVVIGVLTCFVNVDRDTMYGEDASNEVRLEILNWYGSFSSIHVSVVSMDGFSNTRNTREFAIDGIKRFESLTHGSFDIENDPGGFLRYFDGEFFNVYFPYSRRYEIAKRLVNDINLDKVRSSFLCESLGWWPLQDPSMRSKAVSPWYLDEILESKELTITFMNDFEAHLEIPSVLKVEYDRERRVVTKRTYWWGTAEEDGGSVTIVLGEFGLFSGVLLPQRIDRYSSNPQLHTTHLLDYFSVNQPLDDFFSIETLPGTLIVDRDSGRISQVPGGVDWLNGDLLSQLKRAVPPVHTFKSSQRILSMGVFAGSVAFGCIFGVLCFGACFNVHK